MHYTTETGPKLTQWAIDKIRREYPDDVALLVGLAHCAPEGSGHGECFDYFVPANERGNNFAREIHIAGVNHDLYPRDWARCERTASLEDRDTFCLPDGEILYSRSPEDTARFEALRQTLKDNLSNPEFTWRKALELLDEAMELYRNMLFEQRPAQARLATGYVFDRLLRGTAYLNGTYLKLPHHGQLPKLAQCAALPERFEAYYHALLEAKTPGELQSAAHLMIQSARRFYAARRPKSEAPVFSTDYAWLADWYSEMSLTWRRLRFFCEQGNADCAFVDACTLQRECGAVAEEFGVPEQDILGGFDCGDLPALAAQATRAEQAIISWLESRGQKLERYATFEEFLEKNP